jgi:hypothetical protein
MSTVGNISTRNFCICDLLEFQGTAAGDTVDVLRLPWNERCCLSASFSRKTL